MAEFLFIVLLLATTSFSQSYKIKPTQFHVTRSNEKIAHPFLGGLNAPRIQFANLNQDGFLDLVILDGEVLSFLSSGSQELRYRSSEKWVSAIQDWFLIKDLTGDGLPDLLTADGFGEVLFFANSGIADEWFSGTGTKDPVLRAEPGSQPALFDFDNDGDEDFFGGNSSGTISFFRNNGSAAQALWQFETSNFGGITVLLDTVITSAKAIHGASALEVFDYENDSAADIFFGDFFSSSIYHLQNIAGPSPRFRLITKNFPENQPVQTPGLNQTTFTALNNLPDLFVTVGFPAADVDNFLHYRNIGSRSEPAYQLATKNFISSIDIGRRSHIAWADFNTDGLADFILSGDKGNIAAYRRDGDSSFQWISDDWIPATASLSGVAPALVDLTGDGLLDVDVGLFDGTMRGFRNIGTPTAPSFAEDNSLIPVRDFGTYATPGFGDFDNDGDKDLVVGTLNGRMIFLENIGTPQAPSFTEIETNANEFVVESFAAPMLEDWNGDGKTDLIVGSSSGTIRVWLLVQTEPQLTFSTAPDSVIETGVRSIAPAKIIERANGRRDLVAGCERGGIIYLSANNEIDSAVDGTNPPTPETHTLRLFPNPSATRLIITTTITMTEIEVYDILGRRLIDHPVGNSREQTVDVSKLPAGLFFVRAKTTAGFLFVKFVKL